MIGRVLYASALLLAVLLGSSAVRARDSNGLTELRSSFGVLSATLVAAEGKVHVGDLELDGATYNGVYAGPVLRVHPGDVMRIRLVNHLSQPTNLHFHGTRGSPLGNGDNAHLLIQPNAASTTRCGFPLRSRPECTGIMPMSIISPNTRRWRADRNDYR